MKLNRRFPGRAIKAALFLVLTAVATALLAQDASTFPNRPINLIWGYPPGSADMNARTVAEGLSGILGQPVIVQYKPGAGSNIAAEFVSKATPDGYTLLMGGNASNATNAALYPKLGFDPQKDFIAITKISELPMVIAVHPKLGVKTLPELIQKAKGAPGTIAFASAGIGSGSHLVGSELSKQAGISLIHIPYKGGAEALPAVLSGDPPVMITAALTALPHMKTGRLMALSMTTPKNSPVAPGIPGSAEAGAPGLNLEAWVGMFAPAKTPPDIVKKLFDATTRVLKNPELQRRWLEAGSPSAPSASPADFDAFVKTESVNWGRAVRDSGAVLQ